MEYLNDKSSILAEILMDFDFNNPLDNLTLNNEEDNSDLVIKSLVKSITKRKKQDPKQRRAILKGWKTPKRKIKLESPPLFRTDDTTYCPNMQSHIE